MKRSVLFAGAWQALKKNKKRSLLTIVGIIIGIAAVSTIVSIGLGFEKYMVASLNPEGDERVTVNIWFQADDFEWAAQTNEELFTREDQRIIEQIEGVDTVDFLTLEMNTTFEEVSYRQSLSFESVDLMNQTGSQVVFGRALDLMDLELKSRVVVLPYSIAKQWASDMDYLIGQGIRLANQQYTIVGISESLDTENDLFQIDSIEIPHSTYLKYNNGDQVNNELEIVLKDGFLPSEVASDVIDSLSENGSMRQRGTYEYFDLSVVDDGIALVLRGITLFIASVAGISLLIAGIGVMNMMYISVSERTKEIGIRRAMGATQRSIRQQFVLEGVLMTSIGGFLGYLLGLFFAYIATIFLPFAVGIDVSTILISLGISMSIGLIFSYAPANAASNKNIIEIL